MTVTVNFDPGNHQVWHVNDAGDWRVAYFDLELPITQERVVKRYRETVVNWARMMEAEGWEPTTKPHLNPGVYFVPDEPDALDRRRFYLAARFKRTRPEYVPLDLISELSAMAPVDVEGQMREFFEQMGGFRSDRADPERVNAQAKENARLRGGKRK